MDSLMTLGEVAEYLPLSKDTVYRMAQSARIPASEVGMQWRFRRDDVEDWLEENTNTPAPGRADGAEPRRDGAR